MVNPEQRQDLDTLEAKGLNNRLSGPPKTELLVELILAAPVF